MTARLVTAALGLKLEKKIRLFPDDLNVLSPEEVSIHGPGTWADHCQTGS